MKEILFKDMKIGDIIKVNTYNSLYNLKFLGEKEFMVQGGNYFPKPLKTHINGCTWGGSMIWVGGIRKGMHLEIQKDNKYIVTSPIEKIKRKRNE